MSKADSTGTFRFLCDGASPGAPVLWDGYATYTPGLSENRGGTTLYNHADLLGSLVELTNSSQQPTNAAEYDGFGSITSSWLGQNQVPSVTPFKFGGGNGCQSDADTGLVLMGHRYYDSRIGRFISQDPAGDGDNWYAYAGNNPVNHTDPLGLWSPIPDTGESYATNRISSMAAFANEGLNLSANLDTHYQFYNVYKITFNTHTGQILSNVYQFSFAIPTGVDINANYQQALSDRDPLAWINKSNTDAYFRGQGNGIAQGTKGDYKDAKLPAGLSPRLKNQLKKLLDHGGNFNGGMVAEGYGTLAIENPLIGGYAKSKSEGGFPQLDDFTGQGIFAAGWNYASQGDSSH